MLPKMVFRCILVVSLVLFTQLTANSQITIHRSYALFVQSFAKYSSWPSFTGDFKVIVLGETPAFDELQKSMEGKSFAGAIARVVKASDVTSVADACVIYLADEKSDLLPELVKATEGKPILIITERQLLHQGGAGISFTMVDNRLRYDMNGKDLQKRNLKTAMQIVTLAHEVL